jgi:MoaA/NifB/PqqE/SkfB family radical SAM enzyme
MRLEEYEALFKSFGRDLCWIGITGGEPSLRSDLAEIVGLAARHCPRLAIVSVNTNGLLTDRLVRIAETLLADAGGRQLMFVVSVDGPRELHDRVRGVTGAFDRAMASVAALDRLAQRHKQLSVHTETVISKFNLPVIDAFCRETPCAGVPHVYTFAQEGSRYSNTGTEIQMSQDDFEQVRPLMRRLAARGRLSGLKRLLMEEYYRLAPRFFAVPDRQVLPCAASLASIYVGAEGEVRPCSMMEPVGSLRDVGFDIRALIAGESFQAARDCIWRGECPNCWTPCEAISTLMHRQLRALTAILIGRRGKDAK